MVPDLKRISSKRRVIYFSIIAISAVILFHAGVSGLFDRVGEPAPQGKTVSPGTRETGETPGQVAQIENNVKRGDTIINVLTREGLDRRDAHRFVTEIKPVYDLEKIGTGKKYTLFLSGKTGELLRFRYEIDVNRFLEARQEKKPGTYTGRIVVIPYEVRRAFIHGKIRASLFASILDAGEKAGLADLMASLYEYDIDFNRDIRKGDTFSVVVEKKYLKGRFAGYGYVLGASFSNRGKTIRVIRYTDPGGKTAYYHPDGRSVRKMFLRCPLPFMRVTSGYGSRRHPLLGFSARHYGIDLGAPVGTGIRATAPGIILKTGYSNSKGRYISIQHKNRYVTHYYHLSRLARGTRRGKRVEQGQIIGYVGNTGWSTGPHLHYGVQKNRGFINPLRLKSPAKEPLKKEYSGDFKQYSARIFLLLSGSTLVKIPDSLSGSILGMPR